MTSLPNAKWAGISDSRPDVGLHVEPDGADWWRLLAELSQIQDLALLRKANQAASSDVSNVTDETDFDVQATLAGSLLKAGDVIKIRARGICPHTHSTDTLAIKLYIGSVTLASISATNVADNNEFIIDAEVFVLDTGHVQALVKKSTLAAPSAWTLTETGIASTTLDTTADVVIKASATWSVADTGNVANLTQLVVDLKRGIN